MVAPPVVLVMRPSPLSWPAVANDEGGEGLLVWTRATPAGSRIESTVLSPDGSTVGPVNDVGPGEGGTLVPGEYPPDFEMTVHDPSSGAVVGLELGPDGRAYRQLDVPFPTTTSSVRPALAAGASSRAAGWNVGDTGPGTIVVGSSSMFWGTVPLDGNDPFVVCVEGVLPDQYRASSFAGDTVTVRRFDEYSMITHGTRSLREPGEDIIAARVIESATNDQVAILSTTDHTGARVRIVSSTSSVRTDRIGTPVDLAAANDSMSGHTLVAFSTLNAVFAFVTDGVRTSTYHLSDLPGPYTMSAAHPAVLAVLDPAVFLVVWAQRAGGGGGEIMGQRVACDATR